ncbi:ABC transporter substrate-binding protein [Arachnia propionica]|uniref:ABC transporter substrate-binding protein n=1 Tax=Arachnia propionica TaxID=1750 RepID=A0A3P1WZ67_9ACTN|nr:ABC transporter substrate-binding protein [Arachnia propionica]RRD51386.1 ABC transporter substrate-binding protein [Arachnia propionica]
MRTGLSRRALLVGSAVASAAVMGCSRPTARTVIGLTYIPNVQFCAFYHAVAAGLFAKHGLDVELRHHGPQEGLFTALEAGEEQVVLASCDEAVVAAAGGMAGLRAFATCYTTYPGCVLGGPKVHALADLAGRRLGVPGRYGSSWFTALAALAEAGLTVDDVEIVEIGWTQVAALSSGQVDAVVGFLSNEAVQLEAAGVGAHVLTVVDPARPRLVGPGLMTMTGRLDAGVLGAISRAVAEAEREILADPTKGLVATEQHVPTLSGPEQRAVAERVLAATIELWSENGEVNLDVDPQELAGMAEFLREVGIIEQVPAELHLPVS